MAHAVTAALRVSQVVWRASRAPSAAAWKTWVTALADKAVTWITALADKDRGASSSRQSVSGVDANRPKIKTQV